MGRVKLKVKAIHFLEKIEARKVKEKRHKQRIENEKIDAKMEENQINSKSIFGAKNSKYPDDYDKISLGSDKSDYTPLVGEKNYV